MGNFTCKGKMMEKILEVLRKMKSVYASDKSIDEAFIEASKIEEKMKKLEDGLDEIFTKNEKLCEKGISSFDAVDRLEEINDKIAELQCLIPNY